MVKFSIQKGESHELMKKCDGIKCFLENTHQTTFG